MKVFAAASDDATATAASATAVAANATVADAAATAADASAGLGLPVDLCLYHTLTSNFLQLTPLTP